MKISLLSIGKTNKSYLIQGEKEYFERLKHYCSFEYIQLLDIKNAKNLSQNELKKKEGKLFLNKINSTDYVCLLDENGKQNTSIALAEKLQHHQNYSSARLVYIIGGAFGFSEELYVRANEKLSLSSLTFSHQMVRMIFLEQIYRAFTIIKGEKYHHE